MLFNIVSDYQLLLADLLATQLNFPITDDIEGYGSGYEQGGFTGLLVWNYSSYKTREVLETISPDFIIRPLSGAADKGSGWTSYQNYAINIDVRNDADQTGARRQYLISRIIQGHQELNSQSIFPRQVTDPETGRSAQYVALFQATTGRMELPNSPYVREALMYRLDILSCFN